MTKSSTVALPARLRRDLDRVCRDAGVDPEDVVADAVRRRIALLEWRLLRKRLRSTLRRRGLADIAEEDILRSVS